MLPSLDLPSPLELRLQKASYYSRGILRYYFFPDEFCRLRRERILESHYENPDPEIEERVNYYNKLEKPFEPGEGATRVGAFRRDGSSAYSFDLHQIIRYFPEYYRFHYKFGDVAHVTDRPSFLKSRPIGGENQNSVLLKLNKKRHYHFVSDSIPFEEKKDRAVWRGKAHNEKRMKFLETFRENPDVDAGDVREESEGQPIHEPFMSIDDQLEFKFIVSLEGRDVASNVKWIMNSNSLCLMPEPNYETWFMEGRLEAGTHYVEIRDDFEDLPEKMEYYASHPREANEIIDNANHYVERFKDPDREELVSLLVAQKYFAKSGQRSPYR